MQTALDFNLKSAPNQGEPALNLIAQGLYLAGAEAGAAAGDAPEVAGTTAGEAAGWLGAVGIAGVAGAIGAEAAGALGTAGAEIGAFSSTEPEPDGRTPLVNARPKVQTKKMVAATPVMRERKLALPEAPNKLPELPEPKAAPMSAPLPCCTRIRPIMINAEMI